MISTDKYSLFRRLHEAGAGTPLVIPNAWDAMSARMMEEAGAKAIGTTSGGVSWSLGFADGEGLSRRMMVDAVSRIVAVVQVPITADIESGYGDGSPKDVAETVRMVVAAGAAGINLEDSPGRDGGQLLDIAQQCQRLEAARMSAEREGADVFINARIDTYLFGVGAPQNRVRDTIARANAYVDAGANGFFVPGVIAADVIAELVDAVDAPLNIMALPGVPSMAQLERLGVRRVSLGTGLAQVVMGLVRTATEHFLDTAELEAVPDTITFSEANGLFAHAITAKRSRPTS